MERHKSLDRAREEEEIRANFAAERKASWENNNQSSNRTGYNEVHENSSVNHAQQMMPSHPAQLIPPYPGYYYYHHWDMYQAHVHQMNPHIPLYNPSCPPPPHDSYLVPVSPLPTQPSSSFSIHENQSGNRSAYNKEVLEPGTKYAATGTQTEPCLWITRSPNEFNSKLKYTVIAEDEQFYQNIEPSSTDSEMDQLESDSITVNNAGRPSLIQVTCAPADATIPNDDIVERNAGRPDLTQVTCVPAEAASPTHTSMEHFAGHPNSPQTVCEPASAIKESQMPSDMENIEYHQNPSENEDVFESHLLPPATPEDNLENWSREVNNENQDGCESDCRTGTDKYHIPETKVHKEIYDITPGEMLENETSHPALNISSVKSPPHLPPSVERSAPPPPAEPPDPLLPEELPNVPTFVPTV